MSGFAPRFDGYAAKVRASFARQALMATFGAGMREVAPGRCVIAAPVTGAVTQQHGVAHAGLTFALGDSAAGYAALTLMDEAAEVLTVEMKINLLAPATGAELVATGEVVRAGRRLIVVRAEVTAESGAVALLQGTMIPV
ncbi:PaaI family thioesterase [Rhodovulum sp. 12E13]|uniref:PaaI family thioesterase n=1 Tax=Rhodovulum sp. 12E13 TaxID=2203891 RepID=UPI000E14BD98|nr:PaaI family thioesterase [Rhodovulum sp. 12E13]RDC73334.1 PaaI family thioesterase [Rhodovulum sp. 12E13]